MSVDAPMELAVGRLGTYNGFTGPERERVGAWKKNAARLGLYQYPKRCSACGQDDGPIHGHWEDYSEPFAANRDIPLCYLCHVFAVHMRHKYPVKTAEYRGWIRRGYRARATHRGIADVVASHVLFPELVHWEFVGIPTRFILDEIAAGLLCPAGRTPGNSRGDPSSSA